MVIWFSGFWLKIGQGFLGNYRQLLFFGKYKKILFFGLDAKKKYKKFFQGEILLFFRSRSGKYITANGNENDNRETSGIDFCHLELQ